MFKIDPKWSNAVWGDHHTVQTSSRMMVRVGLAKGAQACRAPIGAREEG